MVWPDRSASSGFAWDCLQRRMRRGSLFSLVNSTKNTGAYPASLTQTGQVLCDESTVTTGFMSAVISTITVLWVSILVIFHILLSIVLSSVGAIWISQAKWDADDSNNKKKMLVYSPTLMLAAMPVLAVGAAAEVAQHVFDNWLYLGLIPTYYLATFYSGLALGQSMLALGIWNGFPGYGWMVFLPVASLISFFTIVQNGIHCNKQARDDISNPDLAYGDCISFIPFIPAFVTLGIATIFIFIKANPARVSMKYKYLIIALASLAIGIGSSVILTWSGWQWLHVPTAGGFLGLFLTELIFIKKIPESHSMLNRDTIPVEITSLIV